MGRGQYCSKPTGMDEQEGVPGSQCVPVLGAGKDKKLLLRSPTMKFTRRPMDRRRFYSKDSYSKCVDCVVMLYTQCDTDSISQSYCHSMAVTSQLK